MLVVFSRLRAAVILLSAMAAQCRAGWTQYVLRASRTLSTTQQQDIHERLATALPPLEAAPASRFLPIALHMQVLRALRAVLGERGFREFSARTVSAALDEPLMFAKQARAALRALGSSRWLMLRALPVSFRFIFADVGKIDVEIAHDDSHAVIVHAGFEPEHSQGDEWALIWLGTIDAIVRHALTPRGETADVTLVSQRPERGYLELCARLSP